MTFAARVSQDNSQQIGEIVLTRGLTPSVYAWFENGYGGNLVTANFGSNISALVINNAKNVIAGAIFSDSISVPLVAGIAAFKINNQGISTKFISPSSYPFDYFTSPSTVAYSYGTAVAFSPNDDAIIFGVFSALAGTPTLGAYTWNNNTGFGTRYSNPFNTPVVVFDIAFSPDGDFLAIAGSTESVVCGWSYASGFGSTFSLPASLTSRQTTAVRFSPNSAGLVFGVASSSSYLLGFQWGSGGFGAAYAAPSPAIPGAVNKIAFNPAGSAVAIAHAGAPYISVYQFNSSSGFGTKYANPSGLPAGDGRDVLFSDSGEYIAIRVNSATPASRVYVYAWDDITGFGAKISEFPRADDEPIAWRGA